MKILINSCKMKMGMTGGGHFSYWVNFFNVLFVRKKRIFRCNIYCISRSVFLGNPSRRVNRLERQVFEIFDSIVNMKTI